MAKRTRMGLLTVLLLVLLAWGTHRARANMAPPETAAGAGPAPAGSTQVRMVWERVELALAPDGRTATVRAEYGMVNQGPTAETLTVRFPLAYLTDEGSVPTPCPEIQDLQVWVGDAPVTWQRVDGPRTSYCFTGDTAPWAAFEATFPPGQEVVLRAQYTQEAWGQGAYRVLTYIVETGAGWAGTIGRGEIVVTLPYPVSEANVLLQDRVGFGGTTPGVRLEGQAVRWIFQDLEPTPQDNFRVLFMDPVAWQRIADARQRALASPDDDAAWGALGQALREVLVVGPGLLLREGPGAEALLREALDAFGYASTLNPDVADWHFGRGEMWVAWAQDSALDPATAHLYMQQGVQALAAALDADPTHEPTRALLTNYGPMLFTGWVERRGDAFVFVGLTATPPAPGPMPATPTPVTQPPQVGPVATAAPQPTSPGTSGEDTAIPTPTIPPSDLGSLGTPVPEVETNDDSEALGWLLMWGLACTCGGVLLVLLALAVWWWRRAHRAG